MFRLCFHDWGKWSEAERCYESPYQFRACNKCNKIIRRRVALTSDTFNYDWRSSEVTQETPPTEPNSADSR